ncbi:hypothetical protein HID58_070051 [Brassica napus]|uniref:Uncharacterized protein n=1 Tax=Brassica napus TaxID=3708 RepID=A0ABQ7YXM5_BRANA|nr:hypothetical protein HID58_070051 [Brassica napus]
MEVWEIEMEMKMEMEMEMEVWVCVSEEKDLSLIRSDKYIMEGTTEMVDQTYEFLAPVMVRWKTYNCYSFDHTAVPRDKNKTPKQIEENKENIPPPNHHCSHLMNPLYVRSLVRFIYVREQEEQARLVMPTLVFHRGHRFTDQEVEPDACVAVKDWWFNTGFHLAYDIQSISFTSSIPFI